jgi:hypothetical protein
LHGHGLQDQLVLEHHCGIKPHAVLDTQHCWNILQQAGLAPSAQGLIRPSLVQLMEVFGLKHPNKDKFTRLNKSLPQGDGNKGCAAGRGGVW